MGKFQTGMGNNLKEFVQWQERQMAPWLGVLSMQ